MVDDMLTRQTLMHSIPKGPHNLANFPYPIYTRLYIMYKMHVKLIDIFSRPLYQTWAVYVPRDLSKLLVSSKIRPVSHFTF